MYDLGTLKSYHFSPECFGSLWSRIFLNNIVYIMYKLKKGTTLPFLPYTLYIRYYLGIYDSTNYRNLIKII
jgi:hypothetical protein